MNKIRLMEVGDFLAKILFPDRCPGCDDLLPLGEKGFCRECKKLIIPIGKHTCIKCGKNVKESEMLCRGCKNAGHVFKQARALYEYKGPIKNSMYRFKYGNRPVYGKAFARDAVRRYGGWLRDISPDMIIPIPMYPGKKRKRGYNQAEIFGQNVSKITGIPIYNDVIIRTKDTPALKYLGPEERLKNLKRAFNCSKVFRNNADILIVDDIFTTGATVDAVTKILKDAGAGEVYGLFICTGAGDID